uniref:B-cell receptor CD22 n=1 Tax=Pundamilia nyererei TaxID=303518 RepID=A0A3B4H559_9CICH
LLYASLPLFTVLSAADNYGVTYTSTQICAVKGSTVDIGCSFKHPSRYTYLWNTVWFTKGNNNNPDDLKTDPVYAGRVSYSSHWKSCTLTIRDLRESDSAVYKFRFETNQKSFTVLPGVTLTVTGLPLLFVTNPSAEIVEGSSVTLTCSSDANPAANYTWYKEQQPISQEKQIIFRSIWFSDSGKYCCTAENELGKTISKVPTVSVSPSAEIVEGSSVTLTCSSDANPAAKYTWYKEQQPISQKKQIIFRSIRSSDSGAYYCTAEHEVGRIVLLNCAHFLVIFKLISFIVNQREHDFVHHSSRSCNLSKIRNVSLRLNKIKKNKKNNVSTNSAVFLHFMLLLLSKLVTVLSIYIFK